MAVSKQTVIDIALAEEGYLEKRSNSNLDHPTENAGSGNWTKYARDIDNIPGFYNGKKNGYPWCDCFVDWCFIQAYGAVTAKQLLCQPDNSAGAGCTYSAMYFKQHGQFHTSNPQVGDQIFFGNSSESTHTGLVWKVDSEKVYTIEGNTSGASGVVANGGGVCRKSYSLNYSRIYGYGRPKYGNGAVVITPTTTIKPVTTVQTSTATISGRIDTVKEVQIWLNRDYSAGLTTDGKYGDLTKAALVRVLQKAIGVEADGEYGKITNKAVKVLKNGSEGEAVKALQGLLVCNGYKLAYVDGEFGTGTLTSLIQYQTKMNLLVDGEAGQETFTSLCS